MIVDGVETVIFTSWSLVVISSWFNLDHFTLTDKIDNSFNFVTSSITEVYNSL